MSINHKANRNLMGAFFWALVVWPAVKLAELEGWFIDRHNERAGL